MHEINTESIVFYGATWAVAFFACLSRASRDVSNVTRWDIVASSGMAGFFAFGVIGFLVDGGRNANGLDKHGSWYYLALAALLGLVSKDPDKLIWSILTRALDAAKFIIDKKDEPKE